VKLTVQDEFGCEETAVSTIEINTFPSPEPFFSVDPPTPVTFEEVQFIDESENAETWEWFFGDGSGSSSQNPSHIYEVPGRYGVELVVTNEFCSQSITRFLNVGEELIIHVPNAFTPNEDGINDLFGPVISGGDVMDFEMLIFNRWGELIFRTTDILKKWNGSHQDANSETSSQYYVENGVYIWKITVKENLSTEKRELNGSVTLIR
ncbi:MAG: PKD domain-containing protein, partial [Cryomorphaceae bacterium]